MDLETAIKLANEIDTSSYNGDDWFNQLRHTFHGKSFECSAWDALSLHPLYFSDLFRIKTPRAEYEEIRPVWTKRGDDRCKLMRMNNDLSTTVRYVDYDYIVRLEFNPDYL